MKREARPYQRSLTSLASLLRGRRPGVRWPKAVAVRVWVGIPVGQRPQKRDNLVFFLVRESEIACGGIDVVGDFGSRPARQLFCAGRARPALALVDVPRIVEVHDLFEALQIAVVHIGLNEIRVRAHVDIAQGRNLHLAVELLRVVRPLGIREIPSLFR